MQELRGNVRVFARVRPFLPSDNVSPGEAPAVVSKGDGVGCTVSKRLPGPDGEDYVAETQSFSFDKCFPPRCVFVVFACCHCCCLFSGGGSES